MSMLRPPAGRIPLNRVSHTVRVAQAVLQYGVGAMVDFPDQTLMTSSPEYWSDKVIHIHDERLEKALGVQSFGMPGGKNEKQFEQGISYARFPQWYFCPKCRRFQPLLMWFIDHLKKAPAKTRENDPHMRRPRCWDCRVELVATRIVTVCERGHIDDFPWTQWVHDMNLAGKKEVCRRPDLFFETGSTSTAGLEGLVVKCKNCTSRATLARAFNKDTFSKLGDEYRCGGNMPWKNQKECCDAPIRAIQRGASSVYYPKVVSSLVIPPYSDKLNTIIEQSMAFAKCLTIVADLDEDERDDRIRYRLDQWAESIALEVARPKDAVRPILERKLLSGNVAAYEPDSVEYRLEEYKALSGLQGASDLYSVDFIREELCPTRFNIPFLRKVVLVHKVREVRALTGFSRINPPNPQNLVSVKEPSTKWYPGYEVRGEGIFIEFDVHAISEWATQRAIESRVGALSGNYDGSYLGTIAHKELTSRFVLLHTIAHLLIRQLSFECGYTVASLRERIYCSVGNSASMAGVFIYTASGDAEGTLGGLVRQGYPDCLPLIFKKALSTAEFCSNDPVCATSEGQGREGLNLAACHSCVLLPETSCEEYNVFLDRGHVVGTLESRPMGFFSKWLLSN